MNGIVDSSDCFFSVCRKRERGERERGERRERDACCN
jgi:hypothetical protein